MSVAHRWGRYTKYLSIACLSLAILSTLILNIVSSYSSSKIESNAEPATQANGPISIWSCYYLSIYYTSYYAHQ